MTINHFYLKQNMNNNFKSDYDFLFDSCILLISKIRWNDE